MSWDDGVCTECGRETDVTHVNGHGEACLVCLDQAAEQGDSEAHEVLE